MKSGIKIVVIEDEAQIRRFLRASLTSAGYELFEANGGTDGVRLTALHTPDLVILDLGLPDIDGLEVIRQLRDWYVAPIIILSARDQEKDKIAALDAGADDYLTKPFGVGELLARLRVALRHLSGAKPDANPVFETSDLRVDFAARRVWVGSEEIHLTPIEYKLLATLVKHVGKVVTQRQLLKEVWGDGYTEEAQYVRVYVGQLRRKLERDPARPLYVLTEPGVGYRFREAVDR